MAKKKSGGAGKRADQIPPEMRLLLERLGVPADDPKALERLNELIQQDESMFELLGGLLDSQERESIFPQPAKKAGGKGKTPKRTNRQLWADGVDDLVDTALAQKSPEKRLELLEKAVSIGKEQLQREFQTGVGFFWGIIETRPYMRARLTLIHTLLTLGRPEEAISHMEDMLRLNPNDNQGIRWLLLEWYCNMNWLDKAGELLARYPDDSSVYMMCTKVCLDFQASGRSEALTEELRTILNENPYLAPKLLSQIEVDPHEPESVIVGSEEEADSYCRMFRALWKSTPEALPWLKSVAEEMEVEDSDLTPEDLSELVADVMSEAVSLPSCKETWFCDLELIDGEGNWLDDKVDIDADKPADDWLLTLLHVEGNEPIRIEPGEYPLDTNGLLIELCEGMISPSDEDPRRPKSIVFSDAAVQKIMEPRLKQLKIRSEFSAEPPDVIRFLRAQRKKNLNGPFPLEEILEIEQDPVTVWEIDWRQVEMWIPHPETDEPVRPWLVLVGSPELGIILAQNLSPDQPTCEVIRQTLAQAILQPMQTEPLRPATLLVRQLSHKLELGETSQQIGCEIRVGECRLVEFVLQSYREHQAGRGPKFGAMIQQAGVTPELMEDFFKASAEYFKSRIYTRVRPEMTVQIACKELMPTTYSAVTMGQMGQEIGLMLFDSPKIVRDMFRSQNSSDQNARKISGIGYSIDTVDRLHPEDAAAAEQFGWPVPSSESWPTVYRVDKGKPREINADELKFTVVAIRAAQQLLSGTRTEATLDIPLQSGKVTVHAKKVSAI